MPQLTRTGGDAHPAHSAHAWHLWGTPWDRGWGMTSHRSRLSRPRLPPGRSAVPRGQAAPSSCTLPDPSLGPGCLVHSLQRFHLGLQAKLLGFLTRGSFSWGFAGVCAQGTLQRPLQRCHPEALNTPSWLCPVFSPVCCSQGALVGRGWFSPLVFPREAGGPAMLPGAEGRGCLRG